jgi:serine/threonine protein kinase
MQRADTVDVFTAQPTPLATPRSIDTPRDFWGVLVCMTNAVPPTMLSGPSVSCGRSPPHAIVVSDERISQTHFHLYVNEATGEYSLLDNSRNGTFVNHKRVGCGRRCQISSGDEIELVNVPSVRQRACDEPGEGDIEPTKRYVASFIFHGYIDARRRMMLSPADSMSWTGTDDALPEDPIQPGQLSWQWGSAIGHGAFSEVWVGIDKLTGKMIAIKVLSNSSSECESVGEPPEIALRRRESSSASEYHGISPENRAEMRLLRSLRHRRIVSYLGFACEEDHLCILLEYVAGGSLHSLIAKFQSFVEPVVRIYAMQILQGLEYLHSKNIVHADIKPMNILVSDKGQVKLSDFGASKFLSAAGNSQSQDAPKGRLVGTPAYMSPELVISEKSTFASDVWAFGCVVLEMLTGKVPWSELGTSEVYPTLYAISREDSRGPSLAGLDACEPKISDALRDFVTSCFTCPAQHRPSVSSLLQHRFIVDPTSHIATDMPIPEKLPSGKHQDPAESMLSPHLTFLHHRALSETTPRSQGDVSVGLARRAAPNTLFPTAPAEAEQAGSHSGLTGKFRVLEAS